MNIPLSASDESGTLHLLSCIATHATESTLGILHVRFFLTVATNLTKKIHVSFFTFKVKR